MRLYQWMSYDTFKKAIDGDCISVRAATPAEFNDPFDCTGGVYGTPTSQFVKSFFNVRSDVQICFEAKFAMGFLGCDHDAAAKREVESILRRMFQDRNFIGRGYRIACFSIADEITPAEELLMWSHYGDKGRGVRICVDAEDPNIDVEKVDYEDIAPCLDLTSIKHVDELEQFIEKCVRTKQRNWSYEHEGRAVFRGPSHPDISPYTDSETGYGCDRWRIKLSQIAEIAIGQLRLGRGPYPNDEVSTLRRIKEAGCRTDVFRSAVLNYNTYSYDYQRISV